MLIWSDYLEKWFVRNKKIDYHKISRELGISKIIAKILVNREIYEKESINRFLVTDISKLYSPILMRDLDKGANLIKDKINNKKKIRIVGDYDVDGVMSVYILYTSLLRLGALVDYVIPDRISDGYGINPQIVKDAKNQGIDTIITCDNGIAAIDAIALAKDLGLNIIVTDHHEPVFIEENNIKKNLFPMADAIINPKHPHCNYPFKGLCGAAVAYKLIEHLYTLFNIDKKEAYKLLEYVSIATICDVVDLIDENRIIVKYGLKLINSTENIGLKALIKESGIKNEIGVYHIGFIIGPTINASGRLESAYHALNLLLSQNEDETMNIAKELRVLNEQRKAITEEGVERVKNKIENSFIKNDKVLLVYDPQTHESVAGIIAGRIKDIYNKPTIVLTRGQKGVKGSGRSIEEYNIFEELTKCKDILDKFGGHHMAAGLSLNEDSIDTLRCCLNKNTSLTEEDIIPKIYIDMALPIDYINYKLIEDLDELEPFGKGNTKPLFGDKGLTIKKAFKLGANKNVLKLILESKEGTTLDAILFNDIDSFEENIVSKYGKEKLEKLYLDNNNNILLDIIYYPSINEYMGRRTLQIIIQNYRV
ncbi:single-stranded-DNA-specific exonuclease RecJ [Lachnospiraceae bacterium NSJ-29]|uniref:Single-stranded-DNA-specific exonuclease RecJ n=1 Tax=Wansuia hejianensis TaxID=2763667 RepID=A0A926EV40_9FIRM|nr:single-stranded-DNA-specific exonuclease RecJ [Wansuia hejianensis]